MLWFVWLPWFAAAVLERVDGPMPALRPVSSAFWSLSTGLGACFLVGWIVARDRSWAVHGFTRPKLALEAVLALPIWGSTSVLCAGFSMLLHRTGVGSALDQAWPPGLSADAGVPLLFTGFGISILLQRAFEMAFTVVMAAAEELVFRAFLLPRLARAVRSRVLGTAISALLFASYHVYQGGSAVAPVLVIGVVYSIWFWWTGRIWPLVLAHALTNLVR